MKHLYLIQWESEGAEQDYRLVNRVSSKWKQFGRRINLEEDLMTTWDRQVRGSSEECWDMVMQRWLKGERHNYPLTWEGLFKLLKDVAFQGVVPDLKHAVESAASQGMYIVMCISTGRPCTCVLIRVGGFIYKRLSVHIFGGFKSEGIACVITFSSLLSFLRERPDQGVPILQHL